MTYFQHRSQGIFSKHKGSHVTPHSLPPSVKAQLCIMISRDLPSLPHAHLVHSSPTLFPIPSAQPALVLLPKYPGHPPDLCLSICCSLWLETSFYKLPHGSLSPLFRFCSNTTSLERLSLTITTSKITPPPKLFRICWTSLIILRSI